MADRDRPRLKDEVESKGWDTDELVEKAFVGPEDEGTTGVRLNPDLEERGAEIRETPSGDLLVWEYKNTTIAVKNEGFGQWRAEIAVPEDVSKWLYGPGGIDHAVKSSFIVGIGGHVDGYIDEVWEGQEATKMHLGEDVPPTRIIVKTATNFQPVVELQSLVTDLWEHAEESERAAADVDAAFEAAKENARSR